MLPITVLETVRDVTNRIYVFSLHEKSILIIPTILRVGTLIPRHLIATFKYYLLCLVRMKSMLLLQYEH